MSEFIRCERLRVGKFAAIGFAVVAVPAAGGVAILATAAPGMIAWTGATACFMIAFFFAYPTSRMYHWLETDGQVVRGKRFWTRLTVTRDAADLAEIRAGLGQYAEHGRDPALGAIRAYNYQILFRDRLFMYLSCQDMNNTEAFVEKLLLDPSSGLAMPVSLGGARLGGVVHYGNSAMGRSYAYYSYGHLNITVYLYAGDDPVPAGIDAPRVRAEFDDAKSVAADMRGPGDGDPPHVTVGQTTLGDSPDAPKVLCGTFEFEVGNELVESRVYVTGWRGHFVKLRCTMPASYRSAWGPALSRFENALGQLLK